MITRLRLANFKAFEKLTISPRRVTLLLGPNNAGKSSILAALRLLVQTAESRDAQVPLLLNGIMGDFGTYRDLVFGNHRGRPIEMSVHFSPSTRELHVPAGYKTVAMDLDFKYRTQRREIVLRSCTLRADDCPVISTEYSQDSERHHLRWVGDHEVPSRHLSAVAEQIRMVNFIPIWHGPMRPSRERSDALEEFLTESRRELLRTARDVAWVISNELRRVEYIGPMRVPPERTYLFTGERRQRIGATGANAPNLLAMDSARTGKKRIGLQEKVSSWLESAAIGSRLSVQPISDRHYELTVRHPVTGESENLADVGYGHSQVVPVLVAGYALPPGSVFLAEQPEIHLHPRAQAVLGDFFLELYQNDIQTIVETHSEHLILRLQQYVAAGELPANDICLYYITPTSLGKKTTLMRLDEEGKFVGEWPEGFFPERLEEAKKLSKIRFQKGQGK